ncbi:tetratricopeptide repeat protein [Anabaena lutea]|uniref:DUF563 domain-containing protein n=1 Tax=Anabaena lutea FACHB-196 TaxID=2692881 RepID=A0ABR8FLA5_9NOST|nr:tetratricopeptide repeat protein [Anabaena lutea]MBD2570976.1 DUF563 domain-containing protein [Anabaena lutea FACHB-196]
MDINHLKHNADLNLQEGNFSAAISLHEKCIDLAPDLVSFYWYLGLSWLLQGNESQAQSIWLSTFTNTNFDLQEQDLQEFIEILNNTAHQYLSVHKPELAQRIYEAILEWDNNNAEVYYNLGHAVAMQGDLDTAIEHWQTVIQIQPDAVDAYLNQAHIWYKLENFELAIKCYHNILSLGRENNLIYYQIGICYTHLQEWDLAINYLAKSIQMQADYAPAYGDLALALIQIGNFDQGIEYLDKAIQLDCQFAQDLINILKSKKITLSNTNIKGIEFINLINNPHNQKSDLYFYLSQTIYFKYPEIADKLLQEAVEIDPQNLDISLALSKILLEQNQITESMALLSKIMNIDNHEDIYYVMSQCWLKLENYQQAIIYLKKVIAINPNFIESYYLLGMALFRSGNIKEAISILKQQLQKEPNSPITLAYLGFILAKNNQLEEGIDFLKKAIETHSDITAFVETLINVIHQEKTKTLIENLDLSQIQPISPPAHFYESTQDWVQNYLLGQSNYVEIYPEIDVSLNYPKSLDNSIHFSFRFGSIVKLPSSFVATIPQGRFWLSSDQTQSAIMTDESHFLADISPDFPILSPNHPDKNPSQHAVFSVQKLPPIHLLEGTVAVLAGLANNIYFHWMLDVLPRWELLRIKGINFSEIDYFIVDNRLPFQKETLNVLEIPEDKQINIKKIHHIQATKLIVPSFPGCVAWMPKWTCDFLKQQFLKPEYIKLTSPQKRIYITRKLAKSRRLLNEEEILNLLEDYGFETVILESMSVLEQAALFSQAEVIISPHGSGLTNLVFCQPGTQVIELFSPNYVYHCYWWISNLVGLDYYYLTGETLPGWHLHHFIYPQNFTEDIFINSKNLLNLLQLAGIN